jgi:hypothetical protein
VQARLTLNIDIAQIPEGSVARQTFVAAFEADVATALSIDVARVRVAEIRAGSTEILFIVMPDSNGTALDSSAVVAAFSDAGVSIAGSSTAASVAVVTFAWQFGAWAPTACSSACGTAAFNRSRTVTCIRSDSGDLSQAANCAAGSPRPSTADTCVEVPPCQVGLQIGTVTSDSAAASDAAPLMLKMLAPVVCVTAIVVLVVVCCLLKKKTVTSKAYAADDVESQSVALSLHKTRLTPVVVQTDEVHLAPPAAAAAAAAAESDSVASLRARAEQAEAQAKVLAAQLVLAKATENLENRQQRENHQPSTIVQGP